MSLTDKKILIAVSGGIAAYKIPLLVRLLKKANAQVRVMMTEAATRFVTPLTLETLSGEQIISDMWKDEFVVTRHIDWAEWPDVIVLAPATANVLAKLAAGISDDFLTTVMCATRSPVMIAPAMNPHMWSNVTTQRNVSYLTSLGHLVIQPEEGEMACESVGVGRMAEPERIFARITSFFEAGKGGGSLKGKKIVVTAGPTRESIDPVRFISNRSSGKMGYAIATAAASAGATTTLISGPATVVPPLGVQTIAVETTSDLLKAVTREFSAADCLIMAAAPADFVPKTPSSRKIKKSDTALSVELEPAADILKTLASKKKGQQKIVGFALETDNAVKYASQKLKEKQLDLIVVNSLEDPGAGFQHDTNKLTLLFPDGHREDWPLMTKVEAGRRLINEVIARLL